MDIHGLTVCVDYADYLHHSIDRWASKLASLTVVTSPTDQETAELHRRYSNVICHPTDAFYRGGAAFNKGAAMEEARLEMPWRDWALFFDSDIIPPDDWLRIVSDATPISGHMYSGWRHQCDDPYRQDLPWPRILGDGVGVGYFQLFHTSDPHLHCEPGQPLIETHWNHAGNYDNGFMHRWPNDRRHIVPGLNLLHLGERDNWFGRGKRKEFEAMLEGRKKRGGQWNHETVNAPSPHDA